MLIRGKCHCGNISFALVWQPEPLEIPACGCDCSFCTKHGGVWTSCRTGSLRVLVEHPSRVSRYSFGTRSAEFSSAQLAGSGRWSRVESTATCTLSSASTPLEGVEPALLRRAPASFEGENEGARLARRQRHWIAQVEFAQGDT